MTTVLAETGVDRTPNTKHSVTERDSQGRLLRLRLLSKLSICPPMITNFANSFALTHIDIMSKLIWACQAVSGKSVRLISRKKPQA